MRFTNQILFVAFAIGTAAVLPAFAQRCDSSSGTQIVNGIYDRIKADKGLAPQMSHINVIAAYFDPNDNTFSVKFQGWADDWNSFDKVRGFGLAASCVRSVNVNLFLEAPPGPDSLFRSSSGCASGTKPCGDVCIPVGDSCSLSGMEGMLLPRWRIDDARGSHWTWARSGGL